jgi:hypothetical protein
LSRATQLLEVRSALFNYGVEYAAAHPNLKQDLEITQAMLDDFTKYAADKDVASADDIRAALKKTDDRKYIERALKAEIIAAKFGYDASYPFRLQGDTQVEKALELFPEAQRLATLAADLRAKSPNGAESDAGTRAATNVPRGN